MIKSILHKNLKDILVCLSAGIFVAFSAALHYNFLDKDVIIEPKGYSHDSLYMLAVLKGVSKGDFPIAAAKEIPELGAPYGGNWNSWPAGRDLLWRVGGVLVKNFGIGIGANLLLLFAHFTAAIAMYISLRWCNANILWACVFGVCFGLAPFIFWRSLSHLNLAFVYAVPLFCAVAYHLFTNGKSFLSNWKNLLLIFFICTLLGGGIYYRAVFFGLLGCAALYLLINQKSFKSAALIVFFAMILAGYYILQAWPVYYESFKNGKNFEAVIRYYGDVQTGALKPMELFLSGPHSRLPILSQISQFYSNQDAFTRYGISAEKLAAYLGLPGIIAFTSLICLTAFQLLKRREQNISGWFWFILGIFSFSVIGGLSGLVGLGKFYLLRGANRFSIFILAASFFFLAGLLTKNQIKLGKPLSCAIGLLLIMLALGELALRPSPQKAESPTAITYANDAAFFAKLESQLNRGSMIFNLPPTRFPEGPLWYPELRGFLASDSLRFSYGSIAGRAREGWQAEVFKLPPSEMVAALERYGFSGILAYIGKDLNSERNEDLKVATYQAVEGLRQLGLPSLRDPTGSFIFFKIKPVDNPVYPAAPIYFAKGFWHPEIQPPDFTPTQFSSENFRWAAQSKTITEVFNEQIQKRRLVIKGKVLGTQDSNLKIIVHGKPVFTGKISSSSLTEITTQPIELDGHTAVRYEFLLDTKPIFKEGRKFSFAVAELETIWE